MFDDLSTEQSNPRTVDIDQLDSLGVLTRLNEEDQLVAPAVRAALPELAQAVDLAVERWQRGGRVVLFGAGTSGRLATLDAAELGLASVPRPVLAAFVEVAIVVDTGPEPISGSTRMKAGTAQKLVLNAFSSTLMIRLGKVYGNMMVDVQATNEKLRRRATRLVQQA